MTDIFTIYYCSFCGAKNLDEGVDALIVAHKESPTGICGTCVDLCSKIVAEKRAMATQIEAD